MVVGVDIDMYAIQGDAEDLCTSWDISCNGKCDRDYGNTLMLQVCIRVQSNVCWLNCVDFPAEAERGGRIWILKWAHSC